MSLIRIALAASAALLTTNGSAYAADPPARADKQAVYVCERPTPAQHVVHPEHGRLQFVSARELLSDAKPAAKPAAKPVCMTAAELERYRTLFDQRSQTIASR